MTSPDRAAALVDEALQRRESLLHSLPNTTCYRMFHGVSEGWPGVAVDRYGDVLLVQTWRDPLPPGVLDALHARSGLPFAVWNHRKGGGSPAPMLDELVGEELGVRYDVRPRHLGQDPLLFLDFRAARRWIRGKAAGRSVLNLFAYTCGMGVAAAVGGARRVLNVDFAASALKVGEGSAALNGVKMQTLNEDVFPIVRQLAGLSVGGRRRKVPRYQRIKEERFDIVVLDPPRWARSAWGAVDVVRDYPSLFKPAVLATSPGGTVLATNHVPAVSWEAWSKILVRTAEKAGRPLASLQQLKPEADFPSFDGNPPLKIAIAEVS